LPVVDKVVVPDVLIVLGLAVTVNICGAFTVMLVVAVPAEYPVTAAAVAVIEHVPPEVPAVTVLPDIVHGPDVTE
jgi:hypothetical protein